MSRSGRLRRAWSERQFTKIRPSLLQRRHSAPVKKDIDILYTKYETSYTNYMEARAKKAFSDSLLTEYDRARYRYVLALEEKQIVYDLKTLLQEWSNIRHRGPYYLWGREEFALQVKLSANLKRKLKEQIGPNRKKKVVAISEQYLTQIDTRKGRDIFQQMWKHQSDLQSIVAAFGVDEFGNHHKKLLSYLQYKRVINQHKIWTAKYLHVMRLREKQDEQKPVSKTAQARAYARKNFMVVRRILSEAKEELTDESILEDKVKVLIPLMEEWINKKSTLQPVQLSFV